MVAACKDRRARSDAPYLGRQFRAPHAAFQNQRLAGTGKGLGMAGQRIPALNLPWLRMGKTPHILFKSFWEDDTHKLRTNKINELHLPTNKSLNAASRFVNVVIFMQIAVD
jgi:hypothetical protein